MLVWALPHVAYSTPAVFFLGYELEGEEGVCVYARHSGRMGEGAQSR